MMFRKFSYLVMAGFIFFQGSVMATGKLIKEVSALERPEKFKSRRIDDVVKKYLAEGVSKSKVKEVLALEGFKVKEEKLKKPLQDCADCEDTVVVARYDHRPLLSMMYDYGIVVEVGFREGGVAVVHGWYLINAY